MGIFKRIFGICSTKPPADPDCWSYDDGRLVVDLARATELNDPGGAIRLEGSRLPQRVLIVHGTDGQWYALPNRCSHIGHRRLDPVPGENVVQCCSVGKSVFDYQGNRLSGSAQQSIQPFEVEIENEKLTVHLDYSQ